MSTEREYLVSLGLAKEGRGKFSNAGKVALEKAKSEGMVFSNTGPVKVTKNPVKEKGDQKSTGNTVSTGNALESLYVSPSEFRFPEDEYVAVTRVNGKRVLHSMRECCNTCKYSLTNHGCNTPTIHGNVAVTIERK